MEVVVTVVVVVWIVVVVSRVVVVTMIGLHAQLSKRRSGRHASPDGQMPLQAGADAPHVGWHPQIGGNPAP